MLRWFVAVYICTLLGWVAGSVLFDSCVVENTSVDANKESLKENVK